MARRYFGLIPAAGHSARMGQPKLLLPLAGKPLIAHTIYAWLRSKVDRVIVVVRPGDIELAAAVRASVETQSSETLPSNSQRRLEIVVPNSPPPDMKASLQTALAHLQLNDQPTAEDAFMVAPADMPGLSPAIVNRLIQRHQQGGKQQILAPTINEHRGHPVLFPWPISSPVFQLNEHEGLNAIVEREPIESIACDDLNTAGDSPFADIDTPEQYSQFTRDALPDQAN